MSGERVRARLNELGVGSMPTESGIAFRDLSPDAIAVADLPTGGVSLSDERGHSWSGTEDEAFSALADLEPGIDPAEVWKRLPLS
jgi:hypothetical protein